VNEHNGCHEKLDTQNSPSSPTPAAEGYNVYFFSRLRLLSYTFDGKERWRTPLGPFDNMYGVGVSPILAGDKVVLICDQQHNSAPTHSPIGLQNRTDGNHAPAGSL
jgi:hypothetical protein